MSIFKTATFGDIKLGNFLTARDIEEIQELANRQNYLSFDDEMVDMNPLTGILPLDFYLLPYFEYALTAVDRIDNLAYKFYGDPDYWWCIAEYNRILDPTDISDITTLKIPHKAHLFSVLVNIRFGS